MTNLRGTSHHHRLSVERFAVKLRAGAAGDRPSVSFNGLFDGSSIENPPDDKPRSSTVCSVRLV